MLNLIIVWNLWPSHSNLGLNKNQKLNWQCPSLAFTSQELLCMLYMPKCTVSLGMNEDYLGKAQPVWKSSFCRQACICEPILFCPYLDFLTIHKQKVQTSKSNRRCGILLWWKLLPGKVLCEALVLLGIWGCPWCGGPLSHPLIHPWMLEHTARGQEEQNCPTKWGQGAGVLQGPHATPEDWGLGIPSGPVKLSGAPGNLTNTDY